METKENKDKLVIWNMFMYGAWLLAFLWGIAAALDEGVTYTSLVSPMYIIIGIMCNTKVESFRKEKKRNS